MMIEYFKSDKIDVINFLERFNYRTFDVGFNLLAIHPSDPSLRIIEKRLALCRAASVTGRTNRVI
jgi:hypothetical protein